VLQPSFFKRVKKDKENITSFKKSLNINLLLNVGELTFDQCIKRLARISNYRG